MAKNNRHIKVALILSEALRSIGLEQVIREVTEGASFKHFRHFDHFQKIDEAEPFDVAFVESDQAALFRDYFRTRRTHLVIVTNSLLPTFQSDGTENVATISAQAMEEELYRHLQDVFAQYEKIQDNSSEKELSPREVDVLKEVARGSTNKEIADELNISMNTVMSHRKNITAKLNIKTVSGLTFYALVNGIISGDELMD